MFSSFFQRRNTYTSGDDELHDIEEGDDVIQEISEAEDEMVRPERDHKHLVRRAVSDDPTSVSVSLSVTSRSTTGRLNKRQPSMPRKEPSELLQVGSVSSSALTAPSSGEQPINGEKLQSSCGLGLRTESFISGKSDGSTGSGGLGSGSKPQFGDFDSIKHYLNFYLALNSKELDTEFHIFNTNKKSNGFVIALAAMALFLLFPTSLILTVYDMKVMLRTSEEYSLHGHSDDVTQEDVIMTKARVFLSMATMVSALLTGVCGFILYLRHVMTQHPWLHGVVASCTSSYHSVCDSILSVLPSPLRRCLRLFCCCLCLGSSSRQYHRRGHRSGNNGNGARPRSLYMTLRPAASWTFGFPSAPLRRGVSRSDSILDKRPPVMDTQWDRKHRFYYKVHILVAIFTQIYFMCEICRRGFALDCYGTYAEQHIAMPVHSLKSARMVQCRVGESLASVTCLSCIMMLTMPVLIKVNLPDTPIGLTWLNFIGSYILFIGIVMYKGTYQAIPISIYWYIACFFTIIDAQTRNMLVFFANRQLDQTLRENERMAEENRAEEMRHMMANVAHDLKTVSWCYSMVHYVTNHLFSPYPQPLSSFSTGIDLIYQVISDFRSSIHEHGHNVAGTLTNTSVSVGGGGMSPTVLTRSAYVCAETVMSCISNIRSTNAFMVMTINRCIEYTKVSKGLKLSPKNDSVNLPDALQLPLSCMRNIQNRISIGISFVPPEICQYLVTDKQWLQENVLCLLSNAVKYSSEGSVVVGLKLVRKSEQDDNKNGLEGKKGESKIENAAQSEVERLISEAPWSWGKIVVEGGGIVDDGHHPGPSSSTLATSPPGSSSPTANRSSYHNRTVTRGMIALQGEEDIESSEMTESRGLLSTPLSAVSSPRPPFPGPAVIIPLLSSPDGDGVDISGDTTEVDDRFLIIEVSDTGIGVPDHMKKTLFRPFNQTQKMAGGTGLGLYSLAKRVEALQGEYGVRDRDDGEHGSVFWFSIPYRPDEAMALACSENEMFSMSRENSGGSGHQNYSFDALYERYGVGLIKPQEVGPNNGHSATTPLTNGWTSGSFMWGTRKEKSKDGSRSRDSQDGEKDKEKEQRRNMSRVSNYTSGGSNRENEKDRGGGTIVRDGIAVPPVQRIPSNASSSSSIVSANSPFSSRQSSFASFTSSLPLFKRGASNTNYQNAEGLTNVNAGSVNGSSGNTSGRVSSGKSSGRASSGGTPPLVLSGRDKDRDKERDNSPAAIALLRVPPSISATSSPNSSPTASLLPSVSSAALTKSTSSVASVTVQQSTAPTIRILLADDTPTIVKMTSMMLNQRLGPRLALSVAENGATALKMVKELHQNQRRGFDVILMDLQMPVMDGLEATRRIRIFEHEIQQKTSRLSTGSNGGTAGISSETLHQMIIGMSANTDEDTKNSSLQAGMDRFVGKPLTTKTLQQVIAMLDTSS